MHFVILRYCYASLRKCIAVASGITHGRLYKTCQLFGIFPFIWYVMNQKKDVRASCLRILIMQEVLACVLKYLIQGTVHILNIATENSDKLKLDQVAGEKRKNVLKQTNIFPIVFFFFLIPGNKQLGFQVDKQYCEHNYFLLTINILYMVGISQDITIHWTELPGQIIRSLESPEELQGAAHGTRGKGGVSQ